MSLHEIAAKIDNDAVQVTPCTRQAMEKYKIAYSRSNAPKNKWELEKLRQCHLESIYLVWEKESKQILDNKFMFSKALFRSTEEHKVVNKYMSGMSDDVIIFKNKL